MVVLLCFMAGFAGQSYGGEIMPSSRKMEQELRQTVTETGHRFKWRTLAGRVVMDFPEGKVIREIKGEGDIASSLSPDAAQVAFFQARYPVITAASVKPGADLMIEDIDNGRQQPLGLIARNGGLLAWSPDGKKLAFFAEDASTDLQIKWPEEPFFNRSRLPTKLFIFSIADKVLETFDLPGSGGPIANDQIWSPKGDEILYTVLHNRKPPIDVEIRILSLVTKITRSLGRGYFPSWSPANNKIVFHGQDDNYYLINSDGSNKTLLLKPNPKKLYDLTGSFLWSPDGRWLLVPRGSYGDFKDLFVMDPESKVMIKIESRTGPRDSWKGGR